MRIFRRRRFESDMDAELRFHMDAYAADLVRSGVPRAEAGRRARVEFGALEATKDECRQARGLQWTDELRADLRLAFRAFRRNPGFAAIAIVSLSLGIGANAALFGLADTILLRTLAARDPGRLVFLENVGTAGRNGGPPYPCFELLRDRTRSFDGVAAFSPSNMELVIDRGREQVRGIWVSGNLYSLLGARPLVGRTLSAADDQTVGRGGPDGPVAVISRAWWQQRFGGDPAVIGRSIHLSDRTVTIVGVMPSDIMSPEPGRPIDVAAPMMLSDAAMLKDAGSWWLDIVARLKPGVPREQARAESDGLFQAFMADRGMSRESRRAFFDHIELEPAAKGMDRLRVRFSRPLLALLILAGLVLAAACANVANLMLARAAARRKEFAVRLAIGAARGRLIRQTLTEAMVLVTAAAALAIALARQGEAALAAFFAEGTNQIVLDLSLDRRMLLFTLAVSVLTALAFGILPALRAARVDPAAGLQSGSRSFTGSRGSLRLGRVLIVAQVALSTVLLAGAALFIHSLRQIEAVDLGFTRESILTMEVSPERELAGKPQWLALQAEMLERIRAIPGVRSASWSTMNPLTGRDRGVIVEVPGFAPRSETDTQVHLMSVSPEYFDTFGIPLLVGRGFTARDDGAAPKIAILNQAAARFYFGAANPVGKKVKFAKRPGDPVFEIVGVVKDAKHKSLREEPWRFVYLPLAQSFDRINRVALAVRGGEAAPVSRELRTARSTLLITNVSTMEKQVELSLIPERLVSSLSGAFGVLALVLACVGLYGILAYAVTRRANEIGIRMALGASRGGVLWMVLREALALAVCGVVLGLPAVPALGSVAKSLLYGVAPFDVPAFGAAVLLLLAFAALAGIVPARRASRLDPLPALRCE